MKVEIVFVFMTGDESWKIVNKNEIAYIFTQWLNGKRFIDFSSGMISNIDSKGEQWIREIRVLNPKIN